MNMLKGQFTVSLPIGREHYREQKISKKITVLIAVLLTVLSSAAWYFYFMQDLTLSYNDARSHLNVARRVFDNLQPGFAQIGSVWLPLYHILELLFVWNDTLWKTGVAGSLISMFGYVAGGIYLLKLTQKIGFDKKAMVAAMLIYALNPNLLFMQTTPMTESMLIFLSLATVYHLIIWSKGNNFIHLIISAFYTFLSTLTRYDGWFLFFFVALAVAYISYKKKDYSFAEGNLVLYSTLAGFGIFLWLMWNLLIFGDPLYFATGPFSAKSQQDVLFAEGRLFTKGNIIYSTFVYFLATASNVGIWLLLVSIVGFFLFALAKDHKYDIKILLGILIVPAVFNIASLFVGHSVIHLPELPPYTWFNDRYGLMMLPAVAVFAAYLANGRKLAFTLVSLVLLSQFYLMYANNRIITIEDGVRGSSGDFLNKAGSWIGVNAEEGLILAAASSNDALLFASGLPLNRFITEGARLYWDESMEDPTKHADWIIMHKGDLVYENLKDNNAFRESYRLVYKDDFSYIYKLDDEHTGVSEQDLPQ